MRIMNLRYYFDFWDAFVYDWYCGTLANDPYVNFKDSNKRKDLNRDYMPEPYYTGENLKPDDSGNINAENAIVVLNLNPGLSHINDFYKHHDLSCCPAAKIIHDYSTKLNKKYSEVNKRYSPFISTNTDIPGVEWWESTRLDWISRFLSNGKIKKCKDSIFAMELCPWHSQAFSVTRSNKIWNDVNLRSHLDSMVLKYAIAIIKQSKHRVGLCFGRDWEVYFENRLSCKPVKQWGVVDFKTRSLSIVTPKYWPKVNGKNVNRRYSLYEIEGAKFLCLIADGSFKSPGPEFIGVEDYIKRYI